MRGAVTTIEITVLVAVLGFIIALPVAIARNSDSPLARGFAQGFTFFFRGAPILAVLFLLYYGLPQIPGIKESVLWRLIERPMPIAVLALSLNSAGFLAEIFAVALRNVPSGEIEAARAFGFSRLSTFLRFICRRRLGCRCAPMAMSWSSSSRAPRPSISSPSPISSAPPTRSISTLLTRSRRF